MTQLSPYGKPHDMYKRRLWHRIPGMDWEEVECKIIEPYTPPTPKLRSKEIEVINAPSQFHGFTTPSYLIELTLLFDSGPQGNWMASTPTRDAYSEFLKYIGGEHKFYDERGNIFIGIIQDPKIERKNGGNSYSVKVTMTAVKKSAYEDNFKLEFVDAKAGDWFYEDVWQMADAGLVSILEKNGNAILYFRPNDVTTRAELATFVNRTYKYLMEIIRQ